MTPGLQFNVSLSVELKLSHKRNENYSHQPLLPPDVIFILALFSAMCRCHSLWSWFVTYFVQRRNVQCR
jgi:hypothetical protein